MINKTLYTKMCGTQLKHIQRGIYIFKCTSRKEGRLKFNKPSLQPFEKRINSKNVEIGKNFKEKLIKQKRQMKLDMNNRAKSWFFEENNTVGKILMKTGQYQE